jgi:hypothetical protein
MYELNGIVLAETIEILIRMERYLCELTNKDREPNKQSVELYTSIIISLKKKLSRAVPILKHYYVNPEKEISNEAKKGILSTYLNVFSHFLILHYSIGYLPPLKVRSETHTFLRSIISESLPDVPDLKPSLVLSNIYNYEIINMTQFLEDRGLLDTEMDDNLIVQLPKIQKENPLMWPILIHELSHNLDDNRFEITDKIFSDLEFAPSDFTILKQWVKEIVADSISIQIIGPAYIISMIYFNFLFNELEVCSETHPSLKYRLSFMNLLLKENDCQCYKDRINELIKLLEERNTFQHFVGEDEEAILSDGESKRLLGIVDDALKPSIIKLIQDLIPLNYSNDKCKRASLLHNSLKENIPIHSSWAYNESELNELYDSYDPLKMEIYSLLDKFEDNANDASCIINAGWVYKIENSYPAFINIFFESTEGDFDKKYNEYRDLLLRNDDLLLNSIETSYLHKQIELAKSDMGLNCDSK